MADAICLNEIIQAHPGHSPGFLFVLKMNGGDMIRLNRFRKVNEALFNEAYLDVRVFYTVMFNQVPCVSVVSGLDLGRAYGMLTTLYSREISAIYQHSEYDYDEQTLLFSSSIFVFRGKRIVELSAATARMFHSNKSYGWGRNLAKDLAQFRTFSERPAIIGFTRRASENAN